MKVVTTAADAETKASQAARAIKAGERQAAAIARKAERDARLKDVGSAGLPELRTIVQGLVDEVKELTG